MEIRIIAKTNLGNVFRVMGDKDGLTMERIEDVLGNKVRDHAYRGDRLNFDGSVITLYEGGTIVGQTFGKAVIMEFQFQT